MATESPPPGALFRALRAANVDPDLAFQAVEEYRNGAQQDAIAAVGAQIAELRKDLKTDMQAGFGRVDTRFEEVNGRIDSLEGTVQIFSRVVWPLLIGLLGALAVSLSAYLFLAFSSN